MAPRSLTSSIVADLFGPGGRDRSRARGKKIVKKVGGALKKIKPLKVIGGLAKGASKIAGFVPGVGTLAGAALGGAGGLLSGEGIGGALKGALGGAVPGVLKGVAGGALKGGFGNILRKAAGALKGPGLPGSKGSLIAQLATAAPGVLGAVQKHKQQAKQNRLLEEQTGLYRDIAGQGRNLLARAQAGPGAFGFASDRLNPFSSSFAGPAAAGGGLPAPRRRRRALPAFAGAMPGTPYLNAAAGP